MATNDGYTPYPVNLTAEQTVYAISRAFNLDVELLGYIKRTISTSLPTTPKHGDFYSDGDRNYIAHVEGLNYLWVEV